MIDGTLDMNKNKVFVQVFGPEKYVRVGRYRVGVTPSELFGSSSNACDLERHFNNSEHHASSRI